MDSINEAYAQQAAAEEQAAQERIDAEAAMSASSTPEVEEQAQPEQQQQPDQVTQLMQGAQDFVAGLLGQDQDSPSGAITIQSNGNQRRTQPRFGPTRVSSVRVINAAIQSSGRQR